MEIKTTLAAVILFLFASCASIPVETVTLSKALGNDLEVLHQAHRNIAELHFRKIKDDINSFVDEVYAPFVIQHVLGSELEAYKSGKPSLYTTIEAAGKGGGINEAQAAVREMSDFQVAAHKQIERKRNELLSSVISQETEILAAVTQSYNNAIYANSTITGYLQSIRKVKEAQQEALSMVGLQGADSLATKALVTLSEQVNEAVNKGKAIELDSEDAFRQLEEIASQIKGITLKK